MSRCVIISFDKIAHIIASVDLGELTKTASKVLGDGGFFIWLIIFCSMVLIATVIYKLATLKKEFLLPDKLLEHLEEYSENPTEEAAVRIHKELQSTKSILSSLCITALEKQDQPREAVEKSVEVKARESIVNVSSGLAIIDVIITIAPLLGLLGTASGLVGVFSSIDSQDSDHAALAKGISEALYTTIAGLAVAVPAVIVQSHFARRIETMSAKLELILSKFISTIIK